MASSTSARSCKVVVKIEYADKGLNVKNFDTIGQWQKKIKNNK